MNQRNYFFFRPSINRLALKGNARASAQFHLSPITDLKFLFILNLRMIDLSIDLLLIDRYPKSFLSLYRNICYKDHV